jgi:fructokinase
LEDPPSWTVFDVNLRQDHWSPSWLRRGLTAARLVKLNEAELRRVASALDVEASPAAFFAQFERLELLCLTRGAEGAELYRRDGSRLTAAAEPGEVVDTVGAGDALCGGLLASLLGGDSLEAALRSGSRLAARVVASRGALPPRDES